jgi:hypothetical protein
MRFEVLDVLVPDGIQPKMLDLDLNLDLDPDQMNADPQP